MGFSRLMDRLVELFMAFRKLSSRKEDRSDQGERSYFWNSVVLCIICDNNSHTSKIPAMPALSLF